MHTHTHGPNQQRAHLSGVEEEEYDHLNGSDRESETGKLDRGPAVESPVQLPRTLVLFDRVLVSWTEGGERKLCVCVCVSVSVSVCV